MKVLKLIVASATAAAFVIGLSSCKSKQAEPATTDYGGGVADYSYTSGK